VIYQKTKVTLWKKNIHFLFVFCHGAAKLQQFFELGKKMIKKGFFGVEYI
jgi:hypothetical protein